MPKIWIALLLLPTTALGFEKLGDISSDVFTADGRQADIAKRGEACIARLVRNDSLRDDASGPVLTSVLPQFGLVVAHSRLIKHTFGLDFIIQSVLTFESKDGRFRMTYSDIKSGADTGNGRVVLDKINKKAPLAKDAAQMIADLTNRIAQCVRQPSPDF